MSSAPNQRRYLRHRVLFSIKYTVKEGTFRDLIDNIGAGGIFVSSRRKILPGSPISLQFPILAFGKRLSLMGAVVRCNSNGFAVMFDEQIEEKTYKKGRFSKKER